VTRSILPRNQFNCGSRSCAPENEFGNEDVYAFVPRESVYLSCPNQAKAEGVSDFHFSRMSLRTSTPATERGRWRLP
jgi:hypothetical protein